MNKAVIWVLALAIVVLGAWLIINNDKNEDITPIQNGSTTTSEEDTDDDIDISTLSLAGTQAGADEIVVESPGAGDEVSSPLTVEGRARGSWYFEASAPVRVLDSTGRVLGEGHVEALGEWMTEEFVPFRGTITFENTEASGGAVVFMNDNPSGDESRARYVAIPVYFK